MSFAQKFYLKLRVTRHSKLNNLLRFQREFILILMIEAAQIRDSQSNVIKLSLSLQTLMKMEAPNG